MPCRSETKIFTSKLVICDVSKSVVCELVGVILGIDALYKLKIGSDMPLLLLWSIRCSTGSSTHAQLDVLISFALENFDKARLLRFVMFSAWPRKTLGSSACLWLSNLKISKNPAHLNFSQNSSSKSCRLRLSTFMQKNQQMLIPLV
ncbi:hypothetical protein K1719_027321 [Acacia pycnantha]|nr:hypothetical protein K1719_027321 [Acacia pycnantha]